MINIKKAASIAAAAADAKNASDILVLDVNSNRKNAIADYFLICSGNSTPQLRAIADEIERMLAAESELPIHVEGYSDANWILMDYGGMVVHIFRQETREFYSLEHLWADAPRVDISDLK